ncbi:MAG: threonylcarbamoyl-AMP synthase [Candidatus Omnitrophica bacterium]|nr:threonylcarbamoyl-AMP synthase [Candidatus Omnitrophota bacterium]
MKKIIIDPDNIDQELIFQAAKIISKGAIAALPTETVYGIGARADKEDMVKRLYEIKQRPKEKPFSLVMSNFDKVVNNYFDVLPPYGYRVMEKFWPGPLTVVYYSLNNEKIGVRMPAHIVTRKILEELDLALCLASANLSGQEEAVTADEVEKIFDNNIDLLIDSGKCNFAKASTVVDLTTRPFTVLREGVVSKEDLIDTFIKKRIVIVCTGNSCRSPMAEYLLRKYLVLIKPYLFNRYEIVSAGISAFDGAPAAENTVNILKENEDIDARGFLSRRLDRHLILSADLIFTMEDLQTKYILQYEDTAEGRVFNLKKFLPANLEQDIPDPVGKSLGFYNGVYDLLKEAVIELVDWL